jgi:hypothetical protein
MALCVGDSRPWRPRTEWRLERPVRCRGEIGGSECACVSRPAVEAQDQVATEEAVSGVEARSVGRCVVVSPFSITYRPIEGACFCGPVSGAYRGSVRTGRWGRSATGARGRRPDERSAKQEPVKCAMLCS